MSAVVASAVGVDDRRSSVAKGLVRPLVAVEVQRLPGSPAVDVIPLVALLVFDRAIEPFDVDVVEGSAATSHRGGHAALFNGLGKDVAVN